MDTKMSIIRKLVAVILITGAAFLILSWMENPLSFVLTGKVFTYGFNKDQHIGWALDRGTVPTAFIRFTILAVIFLPITLITRVVCGKETRWTHWVCTTGSLIIWLCLLSGLICAITGIIKYINNMGFTFLRFVGLIYSLIWSMIMIWFLWWILRGKEILCRKFLTKSMRT